MHALVLIGSVGYNDVNEISGVGDVSVVQVIVSYNENNNFLGCMHET